jgi:hypothetical protein
MIPKSGIRFSEWIALKYTCRYSISPAFVLDRFPPGVRRICASTEL